MTLPDYEYRGLIAESWDLLRGDTSRWADRFFFLDLIHRYGQPALDVGCGTGRLLLDYLAQGIDIDGVDNSPEMLAICRRKGTALGLTPNVSEQYIERLALPRRYRTIIVPSSSLQLVVDPGAAQEALHRLVAHLEPGGALCASIMTLWRNGDPLETTFEQSAQRPDGATIRRVSRSRYHPATNCEDSEDLYQVIVDGVVVAEERHSRAPAVRSYTQEQARTLFEQAGLAEVRLFHEFTSDPAAPDDTLFTIVGVNMQHDNH